VSPVLGHVKTGDVIETSPAVADPLVALGDLTPVVSEVEDSIEGDDEGNGEPKSDPGPSETPTLSGPSEDK